MVASKAAKNLRHRTPISLIGRAAFSSLITAKRHCVLNWRETRLFSRTSFPQRWERGPLVRTERASANRSFVGCFLKGSLTRAALAFADETSALPAFISAWQRTQPPGRRFLRNSAL